MKQKRAKKQKKNEGITVTLRANNEALVSLLKNLVRQSNQQPAIQSTALPFMNANGKKNKGLKGVPQGYMNQPPLKPLYSAIKKTINFIESQSV